MIASGKKIFACLISALLFIFLNTNAYGQSDPDFEKPGFLKENRTEVADTTFSQHIDHVFSPFVKVLGDVLFWDPFSAIDIYDPVVRDDSGQPLKDEKGNTVEAPLKLIVVWLIFGGLFFTIFMRFINIKAFSHAIGLIRGKYDKAGTGGEVSHFQALTTALSATVGLGNIAGVALAVSIGGPGATLWMILAGFLGMSSKFVECTLGVKYRKIDKKGRVSGGAMYYLKHGLKKRKLSWLGYFLAASFAVLVIGGSFGGGNMLQANQAFEQFASFFPATANHGAWYGLVLAIFVGLVIIGGIKSIARVTSRIVPFMALLYVLTALVIIFMNYDKTGEAFSLIFHGAFSADAMKGGFIGVLVWGFQRGAFSNEAGVGSASIAHAAARTSEPVSEGIVALLEPFVDTIVVCTMTALVIIFTGFYNDTSGVEGVSLTSAAFGSVFSWFPYLLLIAVTLFAFSTLISWSYYGQKGFDYLFGGWSEKLFGTRTVTDTIYRLLFLGCIVIGSASSLRSVMDFSDMMVLCMAFPNIIGLLIMAPEVKRDLNIYWKKLKTGEIKKYK